ncbi:hypothetical protein SLS62_009362 [Diatrype stigma]|uniref:O-methyltransferase C-terminal domain-containing protein n=1 Tax=Diatrype stigma TaxID=117547 RepID=A0AAN9UEC6_9PEZI
MKILLDHEIIETIPSEGDISIHELAEKTGAELLILERFSRFLIAAGVLSSPGPGKVAHTAESRTFLDPQAQFCFSHMFNFFLVPAMEWSEYFDTNGLAEPKNATRTPFGSASGHPDTSFYEDFTTMSGRAASINSSVEGALWYMPVLGVYDFSWVAEYAAQSQKGNVSSSRPLIVDVGGHTGKALAAILEDNPRIPAQRCILQDRADSLGMAMNGGVSNGVQRVAINFLEEQPTKVIQELITLQEALIYYLRRILSDWPDEGCTRILQNLRKACAADSRILVSEHLLPDQPSLDAATGDIWMMNFGGKWRSESMFRDLASRSGLHITSILRDKSSDSVVIEMVPV